MKRVLGIAVWVVVWIVAIVCLALTIVPRFLDRLYYRGVASDHFDGARFFNPDGGETGARPPGGGKAGFFWRQATGNDGRPPWPGQVAVQPRKPVPVVRSAPVPFATSGATPEQVAATPMRVT